MNCPNPNIRNEDINANAITTDDHRMMTRSRSNPTPQKTELQNFITKELDVLVNKQSYQETKHSEIHNKRKHKETPRIRKRVPCGLCGKEFQRSDQLQAHLSMQHTLEKPYQCELCDKSFFRKDVKTLHLRRHTGEKPFQCTTCLKRFSFNSGLRAHKKSGTCLAETKPKETKPKIYLRPFTCEYCPKSFALKNTMIDHTRRHTGERPFKCETCSWTFAQTSSLRKHQLTHSLERPHKCAHCEKTFALASSLKTHLMTHGIGRKYHKCQFCHKEVSRISSLHKHIRTHLSEGHVCKYCPKSFKTMYQLVKHTDGEHPQRRRHDFLLKLMKNSS